MTWRLVSWRLVSWRRGSGLAVALAAISLTLAGCVSLPSGGTLRNVNPLPNSNPGSQLVITPRVPDPQWQPKDIVRGFLAASGADPTDLSVAREYLTKRYSRKWHISGSTPDVIDTNYNVVPAVVSSHVTGGQSSAQVTVISQHLETLVTAGANEAGRLQVSPRSAPYQFAFELLQGNGGRWRIDSILVNGKISDSILLLTDSDFGRDYLPRNLYYLASGSPQNLVRTLVPYPVYISAQSGQLGGAQQLVDALSTLPPTRSNWLYHAIATALRRTLPTVQVQGSRAVVELSAPAAVTDQQTLTQMEAQLVWTLTYAPDSPGGTGINSVEMDVGRKSEVLLQSHFTTWVPQGSSGPLYYQTLDRAGRPLLESFTPGSNSGPPSGGHTRSHGLVGVRTHEPLPAGLGRGPLTAVAVSPALPSGVRYFAGCRGTTAYVAPLLPISYLESRDLPGNCTSLSWDNQGDCWAIAGSQVYVLSATPTTVKVITPVTIPAPQITPSDKFVSLKVAPDGLRVAMIVRGKSGASVYVAAITKKEHSPNIYLAQGGPMLTVGPGLVNPVALTWWDSNHLLVLDRLNGASQLYMVPLDGGQSTKVPTPSKAISVTANGTYIAVSRRSSAHGGHSDMLVSRGTAGEWIPVTAGSTPKYQD